MPNKAERLYIENKKESGKSAASMLFTSWRQKVVFHYCPGSKQIQHVSTFAELNVCMIHSPLCLMVVFPLPPCSVLWLDVLSITGGRRLSAYGCQNGCVGLALVNQTGPGNGSLRFREVWLPGHLFTQWSPPPSGALNTSAPLARLLCCIIYAQYQYQYPKTEAAI